ncbi:MAG: autotransporter outer membrane beta-barrel domain-containing protein [Pseudomonadota bacterium]
MDELIFLSDLRGTSAADGVAEFARAQFFNTQLFSCEQESGPSDEGTCSWASFNGTRTVVSNQTRFEDTTFSGAFGGQFEVFDNVFVGGALAFEQSDTSRLFTDLDANRGRAGLTVKYVDSGFSGGLAVSGAIGNVDSTRTTSSGTALTDFGVTTLSARARVAYTFGGDGWFVTPELAGGVTRVEGDGYSETGAGINNRIVTSYEETSFSVHPAVTVGGDFRIGPFDTLVRPSLTLGVDWYDDPSVSVGSGVVTIAERVSADDFLGRAGVNLDVFADQDVAIRLRYNGLYGESTKSHGGEVRVQLDF